MSDAATVRRSTAGQLPGAEGPGALTPPGPERFIARAAAVTAVLTAAGALFGLLRDQMIARLFGAGGDTDAFLVAWTVPEIAATLLIEDAMALVMVPAFSLALSRRAERTAESMEPEATGPDPVGRLLASTAPKLFLVLACSAVLPAVGAPVLVRLLAPGLADPALAVECTRLTAVTILTFGIAGYFSAALRAHRRFVPPAAIYLAYNLGILATVLAFHSLWGVRAAAFGVAVGSTLMVLVQLPAFLRHLPARPWTPVWHSRGRKRRRSGAVRRTTCPAEGTSSGGASRARPKRRRTATALLSRPAGLGVPVGLAMLAPVALFALTRQAQVLVERHIASSLTPGAISHLNYAQKVAQVPMVLSLMVCTVTFPLVARAMADGEADLARRRVERDLTLAGVVVLLGTAYVVAFAPQLIELLFQRGAFTALDTDATASVMRVYALGLLGHSMVGALIRPFFSTARPTWYPAAAMGVGLLLTVVSGALAAPYWGVYGIAAANAAGITVTALLLLRGLGERLIPVDVRRVTTDLGRLALAAAAAAAAGWALAPLLPSALLAAAVGCLVVPTAFTLAALVVRAPEVPSLLATVKRKLCHAR